MIRYTLKCDQDHTFDSWFQTSDAYDTLRARDMVACAVCGSSLIEKAIMAPRVRPARNAAKETPKPDAPAQSILAAPASPAEQALKELREKVEANAENVGKDFAREARAIHEGEAPERSIIGEANLEEARALIDEGVPVAPLPWATRKTN